MKRYELEKLRTKGYFLPTDNDFFGSMLKTEFLLLALNKTPLWHIPKRNWIINKLFGRVKGTPFAIQNNFRCSSGKYIHIGDNFFANYNCCILDRANVTIGDNVYLGPNVILTTVSHSLDYKQRRLQFYQGSFEPHKRTSVEKIAPIKIGNDVWICSGSIVLPGICIGNGSVIGAGSVVTKDIPSNVLAYGVPCKVVRELTEEDKETFPEEISNIFV